ncbi:MAG: hypothetical protein ACLVEU_14150 [Bacteroides cellulosilyticus]
MDERWLIRLVEWKKVCLRDRMLPIHSWLCSWRRSWRIAVRDGVTEAPSVKITPCVTLFRFEFTAIRRSAQVFTKIIMAINN